jgi:hypothetical protein
MAADGTDVTQVAEAEDGETCGDGSRGGGLDEELLSELLKGPTRTRENSGQTKVVLYLKLGLLRRPSTARLGHPV